MQPEVIKVSNTKASCDGGGSILGHPKVYLSLEPTGKVVCPYCSTIFVHTDPKKKRPR